MDALTAIYGRTSAVRLSTPAPTKEHLNQILQAGVRAPDHGRLAPWRFVVLEGDARTKLGEAMVEAKRRKAPDMPEQEFEKERDKALRAPTIVVVAARPTPGKIPDIEQILAVGAGVQNMFLAAHALGYGGMWKTGDAAYDAGVKEALSLDSSDHIVAFLYLGTSLGNAPLRSSDLSQYARWL